MKNVAFSRILARSRNVELSDQQNGKSDRPQIEDSEITFDALSDEVINIDMKKKSATDSLFFGRWPRELSLK